MNSQTSDELLNNVVRFRLGRWADAEPSDLARFEEALVFAQQDQDNTFMAAYDAGRETFFDLNGYDAHILRSGDFWAVKDQRQGSDLRIANFFSYLDSLALKGRFFANFTDAPYWGFNKLDVAGYPIFQFSREDGDDASVLFPLDYKYMGPGSKNLPGFVGVNEPQFEDKIDRAVWRGRLSGTIWRDGQKSFARFLWPALAAARDEAAFDAILRDNIGVQRLKFCLEHSASPDLDIGIVPSNEGLEISEEMQSTITYRKVFRDPMSIKEQLAYRYIVCLPGNDVASGLYWALMSKSVVLMPIPDWRTALDYNLNEWEHYVPLKPDLSDVMAQIEWCRAHPEQVQTIIKRAQEHCRRSFDPSLRAAADEAVTSHIARLISGRFGGRPIAFATDRFLSMKRPYTK